MSLERHERVKRLFLAACELDETARQAFLEQACQGEADIRSEVESLLKHHHPDTIIDPAGARRIADLDAGSNVPAATGDPAIPIPAESEKPPRFVAGTIVADRYRIVALLGQGGMGEVYRAEDLQLHRTVALKFLTQSRADDPVWLARFYNEARLALAVTHRHVCRVYDIGQAGDEAFICMEYIDGEDLASLLRRIGKVPLDKAVDIARQLCHGLAAAHAMGVLHRDLKPANIMLDGRGQVRITDFGIAALVKPAGVAASVAGTPAYMAPELLSGKPATVRSDFYALGLVLYEMITGRHPKPPAGPTGGRDRLSIAPPSQIVEDVDPAIERTIMRCLEPKPDDRPASVYEVLAMLPGGDPLAAAVAAGETPSPEMLADVTLSSRPRSTGAMICLIASLAGLAAFVAMADRTTLFTPARLVKSPEVLDDGARRIILALGGSQDIPGTSGQFFFDPGVLASMRGDQSPATQESSLSAAQPAAVFFEYCIRSRTAEPKPIFTEPEIGSSFEDQGADAIVRLDPSGRLLSYTATTVSPAEAKARPAPVDWSILFAMAGLDVASFMPSESPGRPPVFADDVRAWVCGQSSRSDNPIRVEGASFKGQVVYFNASANRQSSLAMPEAARPYDRSATIRLAAPLFLVTLAGGLVLAWRHVRLGRGDRRGAFRLAIFMLVLELLIWWAGQGLVFRVLLDVPSLLTAIRTACFAAVATWVYYLALEPYVRRFWPHSLVSWSRVLAGRWYDPLLGRDILIGSAFGIGVAVLEQCEVLLAAWVGQSPALVWLPGQSHELGRLVGFAHVTAMTTHALRVAVIRGMVFLMLMVLLRKWIRIPWLAAWVFIVIVTTFYALNSQADLSAWIIRGIVCSAAALVVVRAGLLSIVVTFFVARMLLTNPITADVHAWYAGTSEVTLALLVGLLAFGASTLYLRREHARQAWS